MTTEEVPLFIVYRKEGRLGARFTVEAKDFEVFGFLTCFLKNYENVLRENFDEFGGERRYE